MPLKAKWSAEFVDAVKAAREKVNEINLPALIFHGTDDAIVPFTASEFLNGNIASSDKTFEVRSYTASQCNDIILFDFKAISS